MVPDVTLVLTPDLKGADDSVLLHLDVANGRRRLGGSALAHVYGQLGDASTPDLDDPKVLVAAFDAVQALAKRGALLSGHDVSDGGLLVALLEMAFAGDKGIEIDLAYVETGGLPGAVGSVGVMEAAFAEEVGMVVEVAKADADAVAAELRAAGVAVAVVGSARRRREGGGGEPRAQGGAGRGEGGAALAARDAARRVGGDVLRAREAPVRAHLRRAGAGRPRLAPRAPHWTLTFTRCRRRRRSSRRRPTRAPRWRCSARRGRTATARCARRSTRAASSRGTWRCPTSSPGRSTSTASAASSSSAASRTPTSSIGEGVGGDDPVQRAAVGDVRGVPRAEDDLLARRVQRLPAHGAARLGAHRRRPTRAPLPAEEQPRFVHNASGRFESRFSSVTVQAEPGGAPQGHGGLDARRVGGARRGRAPTSPRPPRAVRQGEAARAAPLRRRHVRDDLGVPGQPERLARMASPGCAPRTAATSR